MIKALKHNVLEEEIYKKYVLSVGYIPDLREFIESYKPLMYVEADTSMTDSVDVLCDIRNLIKTFGSESFDLIICSNFYGFYGWEVATHNLKGICKTGGILLILDSKYKEWEFEETGIYKVFSDFNVLNNKPLKLEKIKTMEVDLKNIKPKRGRKKKIKNPTPQYIGSTELYFPKFKKIVNKGDLLPELPLREARERPDFIVLNDRKD